MRRLLTSVAAPAAGMAMLVLGPLAGLAAAQEAPAADPAVEETVVPTVDAAFIKAYDVAMARISETLSHEDIAEISLLAHAAAASGLCESLVLDEAAVYGALTRSSHEALDGEEGEDQTTAYKDFTLIAFGILTGLMLEQAAKDTDGFCVDAEADATDPEFASYLKPSAGEESEPPSQQ